jgi:hypothetical protein
LTNGDHVRASPITDQKPSDSVPSTSADRRASVRFRCERLAVGRAFISNSFTTLNARIVDLSTSGVGLLLDRPLEPGTRLNVELDGALASLFEIVAEV